MKYLACTVWRLIRSCLSKRLGALMSVHFRCAYLDLLLLPLLNNMLCFRYNVSIVTNFGQCSNGLVHPYPGYSRMFNDNSKLGAAWQVFPKVSLASSCIGFHRLV